MKREQAKTFTFKNIPRSRNEQMSIKRFNHEVGYITKLFGEDKEETWQISFAVKKGGNRKNQVGKAGESI